MTDSHYIHLYYSARVEQLVDALNRDIKSYYKLQQDPLKPLKVIVPNGHIQKYLNLRLTEINGISANMDFPFLETGLFEAFLTLKSIDDKTKLLSISQIELAVLAFLCDKNNQNNTLLSPLYDYLKTHQNPALAAQKRWQLAQQLALLFIDYELSRPEMINAWVSGQLFFSDSRDSRLKQLEQAQSTVYMSLFNNSRDSVTLSGLLRSIEVAQPTEIRPIFLFVPSRLSPLHRQIIIMLARYYPVHIYHLNVCREFWQDMETHDEINWRIKIRQLDVTATDADGRVINSDDKDYVGQLTSETFFDLEQGLDEFENPLLKAWGIPGRETLRLLGDLENDAIHAGIPYHDYLLDEDEAELIHTPQCTLSALQYSVLNRIPGDESLSQLTNTVLVASAPAIEVEVSQVYNSILYELKQDPSLKLTDIVVLVTDMPKYRYVIEQVFERLNHHMVSPLRYSISDSSAGEESLYAHAVAQLLAIIETDFIRDEVFTFFTNPCVMDATDSHQGEVDAWLQAAVDLGIFRSYDQLYEGQDESLTELYTWRQGLQRLHRSLAQSTAENSPLNTEEMGRLSVIMSQLNKHKTQLKQSQTTEQWQQSLQYLFDTFIAVPDDYPQEEAVSLAVARQLLQLADSQPELILNYYDIKHYLLSRLTEISAGRGRYLSGGIVCAALQPMRPVPFKVTYVLGLGESQFPGQIRHNTLDLAAYSRRIGDIDQVDNNKYLFLETLMSTRNKLFLSYVGRNELSGDILSPSVVVNDVMDWVNQHSENRLQPLELPLSPVDNFKRQTDNNSQSFNQNYLLADYLLYRHQTKLAGLLDDTTLNLLSSQQKTELNKFNAIFNDQASITSNLAVPNLEQFINLNVSHLSRYLINPTESIFVQQGGILQRIEDTDLLSDEPLTINPLDRYSLFNQAVEVDLQLRPNKTISTQSDSSDGSDNLAAILDSEYSVYLRQSKVPIKLFASIEPLKDIEEDEDYQVLKTQIRSGQLIPWSGNLLIGQAYSQQAVLTQLPAWQLTSNDGSSIHFSATISHLYNNQSQKIAGQVIIKAGKHDKNKSYEILTKAFLEWCLMCLHDGIELAEDYEVRIIFQDKVKSWTFKRYLLDIKIIKDYLTQLSHEFIVGNNTYIPLSLWSVLSFKFIKKDECAPTKTYEFDNQLYFAYQDLEPHLLEALRQNYLHAVDTAGEVHKSFADKKAIVYNEIKAILRYLPTDDILNDYKERFMLYFAVLDQIDARDLS